MRYFPLLLIITILVYLNSFSVPFQFDDRINILENPLILKFADSRARSVEERPESVYWDRFPRGRNLSYFTFGISYLLHGTGEFGYHLVNLVIHLLNVVLVYFLMHLLLRLNHAGEKREWRVAPLLAAALFALHPIQTQAVTYIVQRLALLATLFYLLTLYCYLKFRLEKSASSRSRIYYLLALLFFFAGLNSKEIAFTVPFTLLLSELVFFQEDLRRRLLYLTPFLIITLIFTFWMAFGLSFDFNFNQLASITRLDSDVSRSAYLFTQFRVIVTYLRLLLWPINQNVDYDYPVFENFLEPAVVGSFVLLLFTGGVALALLFSRRSDNANRFNEMLWAWSVLWFFIALSIESSILPIADLSFEHRLYLPMAAASIGVSIYLTSFWERLTSVRMQNIYLITVVMMVALLALASHMRNRVWQSNYTLWKDAVDGSPRKPRPLNNLGFEYSKRGESHKAIELYRRAIDGNPDYVDAHYNIAIELAKARNYDEALAAYERVLKLRPGYVRALNNIGGIHLSRGDYPAAIDYYRQVLQFNPTVIYTYINLGTALIEQGDYRQAIQILNSALRYNNRAPDIYKNLARAYSKLGDVDAARNYLQRAFQLSNQRR